MITIDKALSNLGFLIEFSESYIFVNWLSGALVGVGGSDFIGYVRTPRERVHMGAQRRACAHMRIQGHIHTHSEKGEVPLRGVGTRRYSFHRAHLCSGSLMV